MMLLVDADRVTVSAAFGRVFSHNLGEVAPGVVLQRGFVAADLTVRGISYVVVSTHPEPGHSVPDLTLLRAAQIREIMGEPIVAGAERAILMGDLNDWPDTPMYQVLQGAGSTDVWAARRPWSEGLTCCHALDLSNERADFYERIDHIWAKGFERPFADVTGWIFRLGMRSFEKVPGPYYEIRPSDHAGLVARVGRFPRIVARR